MKLKTTLTALTVALCLFHVPAQAGIPVFDEVANASNPAVGGEAPAVAADGSTLSVADERL